MNKTLVTAAMSLLLATVGMADNGTCCGTCRCNGTTKGNDDITASGAALAAVDVVLVRPITFVGTAVGFVGFAATSPFTAMADVAEDSWNALVQNPAEYTLDRDLGDFR
jgi:hypothetical protein